MHPPHESTRSRKSRDFSKDVSQRELYRGPRPEDRHTSIIGAPYRTASPSRWWIYFAAVFHHPYLRGRVPRACSIHLFLDPPEHETLRERLVFIRGGNCKDRSVSILFRSALHKFCFVSHHFDNAPCNIASILFWFRFWSVQYYSEVKRIRTVRIFVEIRRNKNRRKKKKEKQSK